MAETPRYRFGPLDRSGLLAGLRLGQLICVATGALLVVAVLRALPSWRGVGLGLAIACLATAAAFVPVAGRTTEEWVPVIAAWVAEGVLGRRRFRSSAPMAGRTSRLEPQPVFPPMLSGIQIISGAAPATPQGLGVIKEARTGTYTAVLAVKGRSFALLDAPEKTRRLGTWASVLSGLAREGSLVHRVQWIERTVPDDGDEMNSYANQTISLPKDHPAVESYIGLVQEAGPVTQHHEALVGLQIHVAKAGRAIKLAGGGDAGACEVLRRELSTLASRLSGAELVVLGALTPRMVAKAIRTGFDPYSRVSPGPMSTNGSRPDGIAEVNAAPMATETAWGGMRADGIYHATYWIAEWPRVDVDSDFLAPLLLRTDRMRTVAVTMEPVSPLRAIRSVEHARTASMADEELRRRAGFMATARRKREQDALSLREDELAQGHAEFRFSGYITVSARDPEELETACGEIEQAAGQSYLDIRRLYGEQDLAFTYTLPLCRGLR